MRSPEGSTAHRDDEHGATTPRPWWRHVGWVYLVYLVIPAFQPIFDPDAGTLDWLLVAGIVLAYLPLYVIASLRPDRARWWSTVPTVALGVLSTPLNPGASVLFVYAAAIAGNTETRRIALHWFASLTVLVMLLSLISPVPMPWRLWAVVPPLVFIWVIGLTQVESAELESEAGELRRRNAQIEHLATVSERERLARELHDVLGHSLTSVIMHAQLAKQLADTDPDGAREAAGRAEITAREALTEVRTAVSGWRYLSLEEELATGRETLASSGVRLSTRWDEQLFLLPSIERELALVAREALTNTARHAAARSCAVDLDVADGQMVLRIADDGVGGPHREGNGLAGIRERMAAIGGSVQVAHGAGTTITATVPLEVAT